MIKPFLYTITCFLISNKIIIASINPQLTGRQIIDESFVRFSQPYEKETIHMILKDRQGNIETRKLIRLTRKDKNGLYKYLAVFLQPTSTRGVALLTWEKNSGEDDQWLYLPSLGKRLNQVAKGNKKSSFMGTDYSHEDIISESRENFTYIREKDEDKYYVVNVTPKDDNMKKSTGYNFRQMYILKDNFFTKIIKYYDKKNQLLKTQLFEDIERIQNLQDEIWRSKKAIMTNHISLHSTTMIINSRSFNENDCTENNFSKNFILSDRHLYL